MPASRTAVIQKLLILLVFVTLCAALFLQSPVRPSYAESPGFALQFDGVDDSVLLPKTEYIFGDGWKETKSVSLWIKPEGPSVVCSVADAAFCPNIIGDRPRWWGISIGVINGQDRIWFWNTDVNTGKYNLIDTPYTPEEWIHIAMVQGGGTLSVYQNGYLVDTVPAGATSQPTTGALPMFMLGAIMKTDTTRWAFKGQIDEVSLWNTALTAEKVLQISTSVLDVPNEPNLRAYYRMSDGTGTTLTDDGSLDWSGTLMDGTGTIPGNGVLPQWVESGAFVLPPPIATRTPTPTTTPTNTRRAQLTPVTPGTPGTPEPTDLPLDVFVGPVWNGAAP